mmetsp:Transcript_22659/g.36404  ORF Transcript_22659/g.36404 Transcript_22659/m.36404 type:complete len:224 (+) Transcript_22659:1040-1711(+)
MPASWIARFLHGRSGATVTGHARTARRSDSARSNAFLRMEGSLAQAISWRPSAAEFPATTTTSWTAWRTAGASGVHAPGPAVWASRLALARSRACGPMVEWVARAHLVRPDSATTRSPAHARKIASGMLGMDGGSAASLAGGACRTVNAGCCGYRSTAELCARVVLQWRCKPAARRRATRRSVMIVCGRTGRSGRRALPRAQVAPPSGSGPLLSWATRAESRH